MRKHVLSFIRIVGSMSIFTNTSLHGNNTRISIKSIFYITLVFVFILLCYQTTQTKNRLHFAGLLTVPSALLVLQWRVVHFWHLEHDFYVCLLTQILTDFVLMDTVVSALTSVPPILEGVCVTSTCASLEITRTFGNTSAFCFTFHVLVIAFNQTMHNLQPIRKLFPQTTVTGANIPLYNAFSVASHIGGIWGLWSSLCTKNNIQYRKNNKHCWSVANHPLCLWKRSLHRSQQSYDCKTQNKQMRSEFLDLPPFYICLIRVL